MPLSLPCFPMQPEWQCVHLACRLQGDSGGPLVCDAGAQGWIQAGIASYTSAKRPEDVPGVFTRVDQYREWIDRVLAEN